LDKIAVIPLLSEGNYSFASVTEKVKRYLAYKVLPFLTVTSLQILGLYITGRPQVPDRYAAHQCQTLPADDIILRSASRHHLTVPVQ